MAREGIMLTSYYVGSPVCGPSRAALMTGCYHMRIAEPPRYQDIQLLARKIQEVIIKQPLPHIRH